MADDSPMGGFRAGEETARRGTVSQSGRGSATEVTTPVLGWLMIPRLAGRAGAGGQPSGEVSAMRASRQQRARARAGAGAEGTDAATRLNW